MIEVLFGESEAASMKVAKNKIVIGTTNGPTSVWIAGKKHHPKSLLQAGSREHRRKLFALDL